MPRGIKSVTELDARSPYWLSLVRVLSVALRMHFWMRESKVLWFLDLAAGQA
jgi:hypothetical protein